MPPSISLGLRRVAVACASLLAGASLTPTAMAAPEVTVAPTPATAYQPVVLDLRTEVELEELGAVNPFLDRRLQIRFTSPSGDLLDVPGFFAGDGTGATATSFAGDVFRVRFTPDEPGEWTFVVSFREGDDVAISVADAPGVAGPGDGIAGSFQVQPPDPAAPGFLARGPLRWTGEHYLRFADGTPFLKGGADSPENWLGYVGFDNTFDGGAGPNTPTGLHEFPTHVADWNPGDPDWDRTDPPGTQNGRAIIGALNYLASTGVNSIYFLPMNIGGDGRDSWPYVGPIDPSGDVGNDNLRLDVSKLAQWDLVFAHAQRLGIHLHFVLTEAEAPNKQELDDAQLGIERKLYYRELVARFGYHNATQWNISEEYNLGLNLGAARVKEFAAYISAVDPYDTPVTVHNAGNPSNPNSGPWAPFIGEDDFDLTSLQRATFIDGWGEIVEAYRDATANAGRKLAVMIDEPGSPTRDLDDDFDGFRKRIMWDIWMSGGGGEWFINDRDQSLEDFREFDKIWRETGIAVEFFETQIPFDEMEPDDTLVSGASGNFGGVEVLAKPGEVYAAYFPVASSTGTIDLSAGDGPYELRWFDPRSGEFVGAPIALGAGSAVPLGAPPEVPGEDWLALVRSQAIIDCNGNGIPDADEIADGTAGDCDGDGVLDACEADCNGNGIPDDCEIADGSVEDCDGNGIPDACDPDTDGDGVIDACEPDCNANGLPDDVEIAAAGGLVASYYPGLEFSGPPVVRIDPVVDFDWGSGGPGGGIPGNEFSSRWTGFVLTADAGTYAFSTTTNDGARLWVDGELLIDEWQQQTATEFTATIDLPADAEITIRMEHFQEGGTAVAELRWQPPGGAEVILPESATRPVLDDDGDGLPNACEEPCAGDVDGDALVNVRDLNLILERFGLAPSPGGAEDLDGDGAVGVGDLNIVLSSWLDDCTD